MSPTAEAWERWLDKPISFPLQQGRYTYMLTITDIVTLASQGYKPSDVKELINMSKEGQPQPEQGQNTGCHGTAQPESNPESIAPENGAVSGTAGENMAQSASNGDNEAGNDNKMQVEELQRQLAEANAKLAEAQKLNITKDISDQKKVTDEQLVSDWVRSII